MWPWGWGLRWWLTLWARAVTATRHPAPVTPTERPRAPVIPLHRGPRVRPRGEGGTCRRVEP